jgi:two-component system, sensor histidine kinase LadS
MTQCVLAQESVVSIHDADQVLPVHSHIELFIDSTKTLTRNKVEEFYEQRKFFKPKEDVPNITGISGNIWFRVQIRNNIDEPIYLSFHEIFLENITVYTKDSTGKWTSTSTGYAHPFETRALPFSWYTIELKNFPAHSTGIVFGCVSAQNEPPLMLNVFLGSVSSISVQSRQSEIISMAVIGILLVMLFYNLCLSVVVRDRLFLWYCAYIVCAAMLIAWVTGLSFEWFWPNTPSLNRHPWSLAAFCFMQVLFVNKLLRIRELLPRIYKASYVIYILSVATTATIFLPAGYLRYFLIALSISSPAYFLLCAVVLAYRRIRIVYLFLMGWIPFFCVATLNMLMNINLLHYSPAFDKHAIELALAWEQVFFSLVLGYRYNHIREEKFRIEKENIRIIKEQKSLLRKMVLEQTEEIMSQNDQLLQNQEEIRAQNERLEAQNRAYERLKELILKQNQELESAVHGRTLQLAQSNEELKRHLHQVEQFSFISAHNLRAPVARILGLASILDRSKVIGKENASILDRIVASARDLDIIIHDLGAILDTQKNTSDKTELVDVRQLLDKILMRYEAEVGQDGIGIVINTEAKHVEAVPAYMDSILSNLISNSIKYRSDARSPVIKINTEELPSGWKIEVEDNGLGFDSKQFSKKLFEPFQRFHTHKEGKGLGMFLVKTQVIAMHGSINLTSEPNKGTRVSIIIPKRKFQKSA